MIRKRLASVDDPVIYDLIQKELLPHTQRFFPDMQLTRKELKKRLAYSDVYMYTRVDNGRTVAFMSIHEIPGQRMFIDMLAVEKGNQGHGIGRKLMKKAEAAAVRKGCKEIHLFVNEDNYAAISFYEKLGFQRVQYDGRRHIFIMLKATGLK
ncbi:GNAT family N-acetyltransferase [Paenibacillus turpanensis]|uniref:GNAT family N-acetyltransferase n=1 Tax=Paenibacillus turpanensis TaxID=2689078 RepID=UPI00140964F0|nr:GNAT family N-acetyltransferase [Paenibacillus turpanensis]